MVRMSTSVLSYTTMSGLGTLRSSNWVQRSTSVPYGGRWTVLSRKYSSFRTRSCHHVVTPRTTMFPSTRSQSNGTSSSLTWSHVQPSSGGYIQFSEVARNACSPVCASAAMTAPMEEIVSGGALSCSPYDSSVTRRSGGGQRSCGLGGRRVVPASDSLECSIVLPVRTAGPRRSTAPPVRRPPFRSEECRNAHASATSDDQPVGRAQAGPLAAAPVRRQPPADATGLRTVLRSLRYLQLDPVSVVAPSRELVLWSRLGPRAGDRLPTLWWQERWLFEYWAHAAALVLTEDYPVHRVSMDGYPPRTSRSPAPGWRPTAN